MAKDRSKVSNQTIAGTGPGIPDDALAPGEELPAPPSDAEVERAARKLGARLGGSQNDRNKTLATGVAVGVGSAAIVAALLYASRNKRKK